jgi:hypothetical protein
MHYLPIFCCFREEWWFQRGLYLWLNYGTDAQAYGIPMATQILLCSRCFVFRKSCSIILKKYFNSPAVIDDLGAILVIKFLYQNYILLNELRWICCFLFILNRMKVYRPFTLIGGVIMWYFMLNWYSCYSYRCTDCNSFGDGTKKSISYQLQSFYTNL